MYFHSIDSYPDIQMSMAGHCSEPVNASLSTTVSQAYQLDSMLIAERYSGGRSDEHYRHGRQVPSMDDYVQAARHNLSPADFDNYEKQLLGLPAFKTLEPNAAFKFLDQHFDEIHDKNKGDKLTVADLQTYLKECKPSSFRAELINWMLHGVNGSQDPDASRFAFLMKEVGAHNGLSKDDLSKVTDKYNFLRMPAVSNAPYKLQDVQSLETKFVPPYTTATHPNSLTEFSLDRIANDAHISEHDRAIARSIDQQLTAFQKYVGASGDGVTLADLKAGEARINKANAEASAKEAARVTELKKFRD